MMKINKLFDGKTKFSHFLDISIQVLVILSLIAFSIETLPNLPKSLDIFLHAFEIFCVMVFTLEYILRLWVADRKIKFIFSFYGIVDVIAILPFYLSSGLDLRSVRAIRMFRLLYIFKLFRYNDALVRLQKSLRSVKEELLIFFVITLFVLYISAMGIYYFEHDAQPDAFKSVFHSLWWSVVSLTTVGYGDIYPVTLGGRIFTFFMLVIGMGVIAVPTGLIASSLSKYDSEDRDE